MDDHHTRLVNIQKLLVQLKSDNANERYKACEELRGLPEIPDFALETLKEALDDSNPDVRDAAQRALAMHSSSTEVSPTFASTTGRVSAKEIKTDTRKRNKRTTRYLYFLILCQLLILYTIYGSLQSWEGEPYLVFRSYFVPILVALISVGSIIAIFRWKKWGFYVYAAINIFYALLGIVSLGTIKFTYVIPLLFTGSLYVILNHGQDDKTWSQLE